MNMPHASQISREAIIDGGVELLSQTIRQAFPDATIHVTGYGKFRDVETMVFGEGDGAITARGVEVKTGVHELMLIVSDDTCRRNRRGDDVETNRHAIAQIVKFNGPSFSEPENLLMKTLDCGSSAGFLVGAYRPQEGFGTAEPSNSLVYTLEDDFRPFLKGIELNRDRPGQTLNFTAGLSSFRL